MAFRHAPRRFAAALRLIITIMTRPRYAAQRAPFRDDADDFSTPRAAFMTPALILFEAITSQNYAQQT
jgi:hypothetical protein